MRYDYAYHGNGNRTSKESLAGKASYQYDSLNRLVKVQYPKGLEEFSYDRADNRIRRLTEKEEELYKYDVCNRLVEKQTMRLVDIGAGVIAETVRKPDSRTGASANSSNGLNPNNAGTVVLQKTKEMEARAHAVISKPASTTTDNIIPFRTSTFQYDNQGNLLREERKTEGNRQESIYSYDGFNRQKKIVNFESRVQVNRYDGEGLRHEMEENRKLVKFLYNDHEAVVEEKEDGKTIRYIRGYDLVASDSESARTYYHYASDEQGSITHVLGEGEDGSYGLRNYYEYGAFGDFREKEEETENRFGYNGEIFDPIGGQYYLRARYYNPVIGRFTQEDTYYGDGLDLYAYCANLPVGYEDPSGHVAHAICSDKYERLKKEHEGIDANSLEPEAKKRYEQEEAEMRRYERAKNDPLYQLERQTGKSSAQLYNEMTQKGYKRGKDGRWYDNKCVSYEKLGIKRDKKSRSGRNGKQKRLREILNDTKISSALRGEILRDINQIHRKKRKNIRVPSGYEMAHRRGYEARKGYGYEYSDLNTIENHKRQHKIDGYGRKGK